MTSEPAMPADMRGATGTVDTAEVAKFDRLAAEWWDPAGKFKPIHKFNPVRLAYIREQVCRHFGRSATGTRPFKGLRLLDIGCGGGLLSEPMARLGADVVGVDPAGRNIEAARRHAAASRLEIDYRETTAEDLERDGESFDVILNMEVVEHVADVEAFIGSCARMLRPGGVMFVATINRTLRAYALAIVGAEVVLGWLPRGTHDYDKLVRPDELRRALQLGGLQIAAETGVAYNPLSDRWGLSRETAVNCMMLAEKPGRPSSTERDG